MSPDGKLFAVLGDSTDVLLADAHSGKVSRLFCVLILSSPIVNHVQNLKCHVLGLIQVTGTLKGHLDYSFASAWHPDGNILATGNQDTTCRLWDIRNPSQSLAVLKGRMGAIRTVKFSSDGRFLAMAEPADFVHIIDVQSGYVKGQEIDIFGEIAGLSFSPDTETLFIGVADRNYGSLLEFNKRHYNQYLGTIF